jgi:paraquat-inducible protein B
MSGDTQQLAEHDPDPGPTSGRAIPPRSPAIEERSRWPGWIWAVPVAAIAIVAYLGFKQIMATGPVVAVVFPGAGGIGTGTSVQYQGMTVGQVEAVAFEKDLQHVRARIRMDAAMEGHLGPGTEFWIAGPNLTDLASIKSIISGPSIGFQPRAGGVQREYVGLAEPPLSEGVVAGRSFVLRAPQLGSLARGSTVFFRDLKVGYAETTKFLPDAAFAISVFIEAPYDRLVGDDTRFWNAGAFQVSLQGSGPQVQVPSLPSLIGGAVAFDTPGLARHRAEAASGHTFTLYDSRETAEFAPAGNAVPYRVTFGADAGGLGDGAAVMLAGKQVGTVQHSALQYDSRTGVLSEPVTLALDPSRIGLAAGTWPADARLAMDALMRRLVAQGLRARLGSAIPLIGPPTVELAFVHDAPAATLAGNPGEIPTAPGGSGLQGVMTALNAISAKMDGLPLDQIAGDIHLATARLADLSQSPALARSLEDVSRALANLEQTTATTRAELPAILADLREVARGADAAVAEARQVIATASGQGPVGLNSASLSQTLYELTRAAQAIRQFVDYLDRDPSALLRGRQ